MPVSPKPHSLVGEPDAAMVAKIDEMFETLFSDISFVAGGSAHNLLSSGHGDTVAADVSRGSTIVGQRIGTSSTVKWQELVIGGSARFLKSDGVDASWGQVNETDIVDGTIFARVGSNETITGVWTFSTAPRTGSSSIFYSGPSGQRLIGHDNSADVRVGDPFNNNNSTITFYTSINQRMQIGGSGIDGTVPFRGPTGSVSAPTFSHSTDVNTGMDLNGSDRIQFVTSGAARMTILSGGNVGVGIAAPTQLFEVAKDALAAVATETVRVSNNTAATSGATRQFSPAIVFVGSAWDTDGAGANVSQRLALYMRTISGASTGGFLAIADDSNGAGSLTDQFYIGSAFSGGSPEFRIRDGNILFRNAGRGIGFTSAPLTDTFPTAFVISGDVSGGNNRLKINANPGYLFVEGNNFGAGAGVVPMMDFRSFDDSVSSPVVSIRHRATPGGTVANGFGTRQLYQANSSTTADQNQGAFDVAWSDVTHASRTAAFIVSLVNNAAALAEKFRITGPGLATFGGVTSSQPALKPVSAVLETRLADDSARAQHNAEIFALTDGITAPSATAGLAKIYVDTADGDLKVIFGDGTIKTIVTD